MKNGIIALATAALVVTGGYILLRPTGHSESGPAYTSKTQTPKITSGNLVENGFNPAPNSEDSFEVTMEITPIDTSSGSLFTALVTHDGAGSVRFEGSDEEGTIEYYLTPDETVVCEQSECFAIDVPPDEDPYFDVETFSYDAGDLDPLSPIMRYIGDTECGETTCEEWVAIDDTSDVSYVQLEQQSRRIRTIEGFLDNETLVMQFDYKPTRVILPFGVVREGL